MTFLNTRLPTPFITQSTSYSSYTLDTASTSIEEPVEDLVYTSYNLSFTLLDPVRQQFHFYLLSLLQQPKNQEIAEFTGLLTDVERWNLALRLSHTVSQRDCDLLLGILEIEEMAQDVVKLPFAEEVVLYFILTKKISVHTGSNLLLQNYNFKTFQNPVFVLSPDKQTGQWPPLWDEERFSLHPRLMKAFYSKIAALPIVDRLISLSLPIDPKSGTLGSAVAISSIPLWIRRIRPKSAVFQHWVVSPKVAECLFEVLYGKNTMYMQPVLGSVLSPAKKFENPDKRHALIPTAFCGPIEEIHGYITPNKLHTYFHELIHLYVEGQNPHRRAWIALAQGFEEAIFSSAPDLVLTAFWNRLLDRNVRYLRIDEFKKNRLKDILQKVTLPDEIKFLIILQMSYDQFCLKQNAPLPESFNHAIFCGMKKIQEGRIDNLNFSLDFINWFNRDCTLARSMITALSDDKKRASEAGLGS